ncbi:uncharacterized protein [Euwallacea fornicatus]|uniref:uncharacterized protein n=1 Tax=Euwallacea fornicatus TaxID=995702 RepID=UPI00338E6275
MKLFLMCLICCMAESAKVIPTSTCKCWEDYQAELGDSSLQCVALDQFHVMPCNMPKLPKCECSGGVSSILKDESGTWCTKYTKGEELMRWPCENVAEWDDFFRKHPNLL